MRYRRYEIKVLHWMHCKSRFSRWHSWIMAKRIARFREDSKALGFTLKRTMDEEIRATMTAFGAVFSQCGLKASEVQFFRL